VILVTTSHGDAETRTLVLLYGDSGPNDVSEGIIGCAIEVHRELGPELISEHRPDLIVADRIVVEIKSIARFDPIHTAVMLTYLRVAQLQLGLLLNFNTPYMRNGVKRVML